LPIVRIIPFKKLHEQLVQPVAKDPGAFARLLERAFGWDPTIADHRILVTLDSLASERVLEKLRVQSSPSDEITVYPHKRNMLLDPKGVDPPARFVPPRTLIATDGESHVPGVKVAKGSAFTQWIRTLRVTHACCTFPLVRKKWEGLISYNGPNNQFEFQFFHQWLVISYDKSMIRLI
jgi:hypothetical protein